MARVYVLLTTRDRSSAPRCEYLGVFATEEEAKGEADFIHEYDANQTPLRWRPWPYAGGIAAEASPITKKGSVYLIWSESIG